MSAFDLDRIRQETFVRDVEFHQEINSTNTRALELAADKKSQTVPKLVLAERQTAGRGRGTNQWWSGNGALTFSVLLKSSDYAIPTSRSPLVSLTAGLAVAEALAGLVPACDVRLKWPNDVFLNGRKACGILLETASHQPGALVLGIGLNVNNSLANAPADVQANATALADVAGQNFDRSAVLISVLQWLEKCLELVNHDLTELADSWRRRCYLQGRTVQVQSGSPGSHADRITGICQGIDDEGALILQTETGVVRRISGVVAKIL